MFRKLILALGATTAIAAAALSPTAASAHIHGGHGWHGHHGYHWGRGFRVGFYGPAYFGPDCYVVKQVVDTPVGPRLRPVTVCD
ncbi:MAG TPA: hypothetical protein VFX37_05275 [Pseudolabrys sp.]|nr:hypothetical protein [Pseudolabrys sp.]